MLSLSSFAFGVSLLHLASAQLLGGVTSVGAPVNTSQVLLGFWWDSSSESGDTPSIINQKLGYNVPIYAVAQNFPLPPFNYTTGVGGPPQIDQILQTGTDAAIFLTVYPTNISIVTEPELQTLALQLSNYTRQFNRTVYLRFAPEMQGGWFRYGQQPSLYVPMFRTMYTTLKALLPELIIVWAPNLSLGWPNGQIYEQLAPADAALLDTNRDGRLTNADDAYAPYYPGDAFCDSVGLSVYYKGPGFQNINQAQPAGFCQSVVDGIDAFYSTRYTSFEPYLQLNKTAFIAEGGAAYHVDVLGGDSMLDVHRAWWTDCITSTTFHDTFPTMTGHIVFEHTKVEYDNTQAGDLRDYRLTNDTAVLAAFRADLAAVGDRFHWANVVNASTPVASSSSSSSSAVAALSTPGFISRPAPSGGTLFAKSPASALRIPAATLLPLSFGLFLLMR